jgi:hypothetical protein
VEAASYSISENSKRDPLGLSKDQEKENIAYLEKPGDWFYVDNATREVY